MSEWRFSREAVDCFRFVRADIDATNGEVQLVYALDDGPELVERIRVPGAPFCADLVNGSACRAALDLLHGLAGVSYYKAAVPSRWSFESGTPDAETRAFLRLVYLKGLGEFAHRNGLDLSSKLVDEGAEAHPAVVQAPQKADASLEAPRRALVALGGGKDSLVTVESLRRLGVEQTLAWVGSAPLIRSCAEHTGLPGLQIERRLAPELFDLNRAGAWNGHIPVTAINSAILVLAAVLNGFDAVVFSNERSASYGSLIPGSGEVNHQWSKGWLFERALRAQLARHAVPVAYFSLLRPWSELAVARQFARLDRYDAHFSSCNRNFHILGSRPVNRWCGACPKCRFVFLALAPFMPKPRLMGIFGRNLLDDVEQMSGFDALIEYRDHKPFECVGEASESRAAFALLATQPAWREDLLVARFHAEIAPQLTGADLDMDALMLPHPLHAIPVPWWERLHETG
ncbi:MAG: endonuclease domain-containing protein [Xanthomonadales bacterium]|nr:endonuclease domain-containing protein [Xanthomonadales bacterium]